VKKFICVKLFFAILLNLLVMPVANCGGKKFRQKNSGYGRCYRRDKRSVRNKKFVYKRRKKEKRRKSKERERVEKLRINLEEKKKFLRNSFYKKRVGFGKRKKRRKVSRRDFGKRVSSSGVKIGTKFLILIFLCMFLSSSYARCVDGLYHFEIYDDIDELLFIDNVNCMCVPDGYHEEPVLVCPRLYGQSELMCESGTKAAAILGPPFSDYFNFFLKPKVVHIDCDCHPDGSIICYPAGLLGGLDEESIAPFSFIDVIGEFSRVVIPILSVAGCIVVPPIFYYMFKKVMRKMLEESRQELENFLRKKGITAVSIDGSSFAIDSTTFEGETEPYWSSDLGDTSVEESQ